MEKQLIQDEREWQNEFGILPPESDHPVITSTAKTSNTDRKMGGKLVNLTEFSGFLAENNSAADFSTMSLGKYFGNRCQDVHEMIPGRSPTKQKPIALLGDSYRSGSDYSGVSGDSKKYSQGNLWNSIHVQLT